METKQTNKKSAQHSRASFKSSFINDSKTCVLVTSPSLSKIPWTIQSSEKAFSKQKYFFQYRVTIPTISFSYSFPIISQFKNNTDAEELQSTAGRIKYAANILFFLLLDY